MFKCSLKLMLGINSFLWFPGKWNSHRFGVCFLNTAMTILYYIDIFTIIVADKKITAWEIKCCNKVNKVFKHVFNILSNNLFQCFPSPFTMSYDLAYMTKSHDKLICHMIYHLSYDLALITWLSDINLFNIIKPLNHSITIFQCTFKSKEISYIQVSHLAQDIYTFHIVALQTAAKEHSLSFTFFF